jgi:hypothetical protein
MSTVEEFLANNKPFDGEKHPSFEFHNVGDTAHGTLIEAPRVVEHPDKFKQGASKTSLVCNLRTNDGEIRTLWVEQGKQIATAVVEAVQAAGASTIAEGGQLAVRFTETKDTGKGNPMKVFAAVYQPPAPSTAIDDIFGQ